MITNMLSGYETDIGHDFRGTVLSVPASYFTCTAAVASQINVTVGYGVFPQDYVPTAADLIDGSLKQWPWMFYRRVLTPFNALFQDQSMATGAINFDTNSKASRRLSQASTVLNLMVANHGAQQITFTHWSNILLTS